MSADMNVGGHGNLGGHGEPDAIPSHANPKTVGGQHVTQPKVGPGVLPGNAGAPGAGSHAPKK
jgi:hypothetical protein